MVKRNAQKLWSKDLPKSKMVRPRRLSHRLKYMFWKGFTPIHPYMRDAALRLGIIHHEPGRQNFPVGRVAPHVSVEEVVEHLIEKGFGNHFVAWRDDDELVSLRHTDDFEYQYHLRIYEDGEIRGHFEYTPECYPILHIKEIGMEDRREHFLSILEGKVVAENR